MQVLLDKKTSIWVSASAGTGKTKVTIDRILALLLQDVEASKILAITFTNKAAAEMLQRLSDYIQKLANYKDAELVKFLEEFGLRHLFFGAEKLTKLKLKLQQLKYQQHQFKILTIHAFCQNILETYAYEANIKENFEIIDDNYAQQLLAIAKERIFANEEFKPILGELVKEYHYDYIDNIFADIIKKRTEIKYILSFYKDFNAYKKSLFAFFQIKEDADYEKNIISSFKADLDLAFLQKLAQEISLNGSDNDKKRLVNLKLLIKNFNDLDFNLFQSYFCTTKNEFRKSVVIKKVAKNITAYQEVINSFASSYNAHYTKLKQYQALDLAENIALIARLLLAHYSKLKQEENVVDYNDIILLVLNLLKDKNHKDNILYNYNFALEHILLDEAQDTSPWQWQILDLLLEEFFSTKENNQNNLARSFFIVGDEKQSIYSFQGAEHELFHRVKSKYKQKLEFIGMNMSIINLEYSYRSVADILSFVDNFSNHNLIKDKLVIDKIDIQHKLTRENQCGAVNLWPKMVLKKPVEAKYYHYPDKFTVKKSEFKGQADLIAADIQSKLADQELALKASDILILVRDRGKIYLEIINSLREYGINFQSDEKFSLLDKIIIMDLLAIVKFCYDNSDDLNLAALLKSPLFNLTEQDIFNLSYKRADNSIFANLLINKDYLNSLAILNDLKAKFHLLDLEEFFSYILDSLALREKYYQIYGALAEQLIMLFLNIAKNFNKRSKNKKEFLEFIYSYKISAKNEILKSSELVTIMTMHQAKGLQEKVTYVVLSGKKKKNNTDFTLLTNKYNYIFLKHLDVFDEVKELIRSKEQNQLSEEIRLLYVAFTRARDILEIVPFTEDSSKNIDWLYEILQEFSSLKDVNKLAYYKNPELSITENTIKITEYNSANLALNQKAETVIESKLIINQNRDIGIVYHDIFNYLVKGGNIDILAKFIEQKKYLLLAKEKLEIIKQVKKIYNDDKLNYIFNVTGYAELELTGKFAAKLITGRIDRLIISDHIIEIIDYKYETGNEIKAKYFTQLDKYAALVAANFTANKKIIKKILFIKSRKLITL